MSEYAVKYPGGELDLPEVPSTVGEPGLNIAPFMKTTGHVTYDIGFMNTAACSSAITYIDGDAGILRYRGYPIEQLAEQSTFLETAALLIDGNLPTAGSLSAFETEISRHLSIPEGLKGLYSGFPRDAHPMPILSAAVSALSTFHQDELDPYDTAQVQTSTFRLLGALPTIAAYAYKHSQGEAFVDPDPSLGYVANFLRMTFGKQGEEYALNPAVVSAVDTLLLLHADHEQNCSTSTVRIVGSADANLYASVSAGVNALFGPLHGGANQAVMEMLQEIKDAGGDVAEFVRKVKNREDGVKLMGFGHRVYKSYDPRAAIVRGHVDSVLAALGVHDPLLDIARELEATALGDDFFVSRKLYPNVDFYTGILYKAMGFPTDMFTVMFALGRLPGWIAQWREMIEDSATKIGRPRQVYIGSDVRDYTPITAR
ncbi:MAG: citrate synthase [Candidatus Nanopelagicales bacterium]|nr:citrate synthase [Candidatus Nanopelagicales bacterium]